MFWEFHSGSKPLSFIRISERLESGGYQSANAWAADIRLLLKSAIADSPALSLRGAAARQLQSDLEREMFLLSPVLSPHTLRLQFAQDRFQRFLARTVPEIPEAAEPPDPDCPAAAEILKMQITRENLFDSVRALASSSLILRVAAVVHHLQPEALHLGDEMMILFSVMTEETLEQLGRFVHELLREAAIGEINPFIQTPGQTQRPAICD
jgi:hypothetical protein